MTVPGRRSLSTPARLRCTWEPPAEVAVHTVPSADGWAGKYTEPTTDGDGRGAWAPFPSLPPSLCYCTPGQYVRRPPLGQVLWAPPALSDEKKRRTPRAGRADGRASQPPNHAPSFQKAVARPQRAGWVQPRRTLMPCPPCLSLGTCSAASCCRLHAPSRGSE